MIDEDVRNNSAWNHRWFLRFGAEDLRVAEESGGGMGGLKGKNGIVDEELVDLEIEYAQGKIELAPMNLSAWNYLRGVVRRGGRGMEDMEEFCLRFVGVDGDVETLDEPDKGVKGVRSSHAVEWLAEIFGSRGDLKRAAECWDVLGRKWDPVRKNYWEHMRKEVEREVAERNQM